MLGREPEPDFELRLDTASLATADVRRRVREYLAARSTPDSDLYGCEIIVGELLANVIRYAPGPLHLTIGWSLGEAVLRVSDTGPRFALPPRMPDEQHEGGRGLPIIAALARAVDVVSEPPVGTTVRVILPVRFG